MTDLIEVVARAICKSGTCEGISCCQWPAQGGRTKCPVKDGGYTDAARSAIAALDTFRAEEKRKNCKHDNRIGNGSVGSDGSSSISWYCRDCGKSYESKTPSAVSPADGK